MPRKPSVAIAVPVYRSRLHPEEQQSLRHLQAFLGEYDRYFVAPADLRPSQPGFGRMVFDDVYFESVQAYNRLLLSAPFYRAFEPYQFLLVYQLDCLVFRDALPEWCEASFDYVGAPWLRDPQSPRKGFSRVGNGGLSLRRVDSFLRVLESERFRARGSGLLRHRLHAPMPDLPWRRLLKRLRVLRDARRGVGWYTRHYSLNEDRFWSDRAALFDPDFRIAPVEAALGFSFERAPRYCYECHGRELPFGCHAWSRWDRDFWEPHLIHDRV